VTAAYDAPELLYHGRPMTFTPINVSLTHLIATLHQNVPQVVILEPGDATRYTLLLVPLNLGDDVSAHLDAVGIPSDAADGYLFVSKLDTHECPGTWIPFGSGLTVGTYDLPALTGNAWSCELLAWWFTHLYRLL